MTTDELKERVQGIDKASLPGDFRCGIRDHLVIAVARDTLKITGGTVQQTLQQFEFMDTFIRKMENQYGRFPVVRMRNDFVWDVIHGRMEYRDFAVLVGVYSVIGAKDFPVRIIRQRIIAAAMGYKSPSMMTPEVLKAREDKAQPLTENQLRCTLDGLEARSLFARVQAS